MSCKICTASDSVLRVSINFVTGSCNILPTRQPNANRETKTWRSIDSEVLEDIQPPNTEPKAMEKDGNRFRWMMSQISPEVR